MIGFDDYDCADQKHEETAMITLNDDDDDSAGAEWKANWNDDDDSAGEEGKANGIMRFNDDEGVENGQHKSNDENWMKDGCKSPRGGMKGQRNDEVQW